MEISKLFHFQDAGKFMNISIETAIKHFFKNSSFSMVYSEALANALDAQATSVSILIQIDSFQSPQSLSIIIKDNGVGFKDENFTRFSSLLESKDKQHKGLGRLIFLQYFQEVFIESTFSKKKRTFTFDSQFQGNSKIEDTEETSNTSTLSFREFKGERFQKYGLLLPKEIIDLLKWEFMPRFFAMKKEKKQFKLIIELQVKNGNPDKDFVSGVEIFELKDLPDFTNVPIIHSLDIFHNELSLFYRIELNNYKNSSIAALCVDGRAIKIPILNEIRIPQNICAYFFLSSPFFDSQCDDSRQEVTLDSEIQKTVHNVFYENIVRILNANIPSIHEKNEIVRQRLSSIYPHLDGYFSREDIGLLDEDKTIRSAQNRFFDEQKEILSSSTLSDEQYHKSLTQATRVLTEYILYRNLIIKKLSEMNSEDREANIHNLIIPKGRELQNENFIQDLYNNNAWLLDDKYMGYQYALSDKSLGELIRKISEVNETEDDHLRPDIAIVFSDNIDEVNHPVDIVIVELKKRNLKYLDNMRVIEQIKQRARRLLAFYPNKIQRMWFFGIVDFTKELMTEMYESWKPIYSLDKVFYQEFNLMALTKNSHGETQDDKKYPVSVTLMSFDALWKDAERRNKTFLEILKTTILKHTQSNQ